MTSKQRTSCELLLERVSAYLDGDLAAAECRTIDRHCRACPRCTRLLADLRRTSGLCRRAARTPLPAAVRKRARQRIRALLAGKSRRST